MAMVLDAFASYLVETLTKAAADEVGMMLGVSGEITNLRDKFEDLNNFLADADRRNITDKSVQKWVGELKRAMYEADDILDLCQLKDMEQGSSSADGKCCNPLLFCMRNPFHAHEIGTRIKALNQTLDDIKQRSADFNFICRDGSSNVHASHHGNPNRETVGDFDRSAVVGEMIEEDTRALVAKIMQTGNEGNDSIMVVAIVGVGGIGKTTLAQKVFNDEAIQSGFAKKIWLSVNQNFSDVDLLRRAIIGAGGNAQQAENVKDALHHVLKDALTGHKTLLIMDDVWNHRAWEDVLKLPFNSAASGSRVLITTRHEGVTQGVKAISPYHDVGALGPDDAWLLLKKQVFSSKTDEDSINALKDIGLKIIQKYGCLPLAVKVMGGLLCERRAERCDWEQVLERSITELPEDLNYAVYLSYEDMSPDLKQCFLYCSLLPNSKTVPMDQIVAMWISEGFIHGNSCLEESGRNYYNELISRNLIEPSKLYVQQAGCSMHDVIRSFAQYMTKDEALVAHDGDINIPTIHKSQKFLRLSIFLSGELDWNFLHKKQSVRTLVLDVEMKLSDSLVTFSSLRVLHVVCADMTGLVKSMHKLKHLRYVALGNTDISELPVNIGEMQLLQFLSIGGFTKLVNLPDTIVKLGQLRLLNIPSITMIPRGFRRLTNLRRLTGFQAHVDDDWCSLDELGSLSHLRLLELHQLENVSDASFAANVGLDKKMHLIDLFLYCTSRLGHDRTFTEGLSEEEWRQIKDVFDKLRPPPCVQNVHIIGYFGQQLPSWMMSMSTVPLFPQKKTMSELKSLSLMNLDCCTELPNGLCELPSLQLFQVNHAPCIKRVGTGFLQAEAAPFPRLNNLRLIKLVEWDEWEWEEQVEAMPRLEELFLENCKLRRVPPGLACNASALKVLTVQDVENLNYLESFPSVVELTVIQGPNLERITNFTKLQKLTIRNCPKLKALERIPALERLFLKDYTMEELPEYMRDIKPRHLQLFCRLWLLSLVAAGESGTEWDKFSHVQHVKAYAPDGDNEMKWYILYTGGDNFKLVSNVRCSTVFPETLSSCMMDTQGFESVYKMKTSAFSYICGLVKIPFFEDMMARNHTFADGKVMSLQDWVAIAVRMLNSGEPSKTVGSSLGVNESTVSLVTQMFVEAMCERAMDHLCCPGPTKMEKIKRKFDKIHGLPNCCGVVHRIPITFGSQDHESVLLQAAIDPDMRFTQVWLASDLLELDSDFLKSGWLKLSDGSEDREYVIGDARYTLCPWLLTPYQLENEVSDSNPKVEFNRKHSAATAVALRALARLKDTWKCLHGEGWHPSTQPEIQMMVYVCCALHNIVIDMENYRKQVRQVAEEDAIRVIQSGVHTMAVEEEQEALVVASSSGDKNKENEINADRGKGKVPDREIRPDRRLH